MKRRSHYCQEPPLILSAGGTRFNICFQNPASSSTYCQESATNVSDCSTSCRRSAASPLIYVDGKRVPAISVFSRKTLISALSEFTNVTHSSPGSLSKPSSKTSCLQM